ncbi:hypothetical protein [Candidatus Carsonella ruddii]|uniref:hypothetical protein n=1 Tax=Carsonella ruddii TaxID=114186 RepID=UPI003D9A259B
MQFFLKNKFVFGDSCSGKTFIFKNINIKKIDTDYLLKYKKIFFKYEFFFRIIEKKILFLINKTKNLFFIGGGIVPKNVDEFLLYKNNSIINQKKRLIFDNFNRPTIKNDTFLKIRFCIRKKMYIKIFNICFKKCLKCNILII